MKDQQEKFAPVVPEFLVEIRSPGNSVTALRSKMREWVENGCRLAWLIDPFEREVHIYRPPRRRAAAESTGGGAAGVPDGSVARQPSGEPLTGEDVLPGFSFDPRSLP